MRDDAGLSWTAIGQRLGINRGTAQKVNDFNTLVGITAVNTALERSTKGQRKMVPHRIACELAALQFSAMPKACLKAVWESISQERLESLVRSMPARLQAVIDAGEEQRHIEIPIVYVNYYRVCKVCS